MPDTALKTHNTIVSESDVRANARAAACDLDGETVILNLDSGIYFGLNSVGSSVWRRIQSETSVQQLIDELVVEYQVDCAQCDREVTALLEGMLAHGLIEVTQNGQTA